MKCWEYLVEDVQVASVAWPADRLAYLNGRGNEGWELVQSQPLIGGSIVTMTWKRPINEERLIDE